MTTTTAPRVPLMRLARTVLLAILLAATTFVVLASPTDLARPEALQPDTAAAYACADGPAFHGWLTNSTSSHPQISQSTDGWVYGYISNVDDDWSCTYWWRYDGLAWTRNADGSKGNFAWGILIHSQSVSCNWAIGSTDYLKANSTSDCPDTDAEYAHHIRLKDTDTGGVLDGIYHQDASPDGLGDFMFIHSSCETYYGASPTSWNENFNSGNEDNRPGAANCDPTDLDGTNTTQAISVDTTPPTGISISINDGAAATNDPSVTLGGIAATDSVSGVADMRFSNNGSTWSSWEPYSASRAAAWDLTTATYGGTSADGTKTVYVQFRDALGNYPSTAISATIELDRTAPSPPSTPDLDPASDTGASDTDDITSDRTPTFNGTAAPGVTVTVTAGAYALPPGQASLQDGSWSVTAATDLDPGEYAVTATATDDVGNTSLTSSALDVTITDSDVNLVWPADGATLFATETLEVSGLPPGMTSVTYLVDGVSVGSVSAVPWTLDWDTTTATDDAHTVHAEATTASGTASSQIATVTVDNTLASTERLQLDHDSGHITLDEYAVNGVYAAGAPQVLPTRYRSVTPDPSASGGASTYLALWDSLSQAAQDEIDAFLGQPLRGTFYASSLLPSHLIPVQPGGGITDPCLQVEILDPFTELVTDTKISCTHETTNFVIDYLIYGDGMFDGDAVSTTTIVNGLPEIIDAYSSALEVGYGVYADAGNLGYRSDWQGKIPVQIENLDFCDACGLVLPSFSPAAATITMEPVAGSPHFLAHHELFHVFQWHLVTPEDWIPDTGSLMWLLESTADWAASYVAHVTPAIEDDGNAYVHLLSTFLAHPGNLLNEVTFDVEHGRQYGAWLFDEYLVDEANGGLGASVIKEIWTELTDHPQAPFAAVEQVLSTQHSTSLVAVLPEFWRANYLLAYADSDVESEWRDALANNAPTAADDYAPARPGHDQQVMPDNVPFEGYLTVERGGARFLELIPSSAGTTDENTPGVTGEFAIAVSNFNADDLDARVLVLRYEKSSPPLVTRCDEVPIAVDANGNGSVSVPLTPACRYAVLIAASKEYPIGSGLFTADTFQWSATFNRNIVTNDLWKTLELEWDGGVTNPEPADWKLNGFNDAGWTYAHVPNDPYPAWVDIPDADWMSGPGYVNGHLKSEIWIARLEFELDGSITGDGLLEWNVDNWASIWINGNLIGTEHSGTWTSVTTTTVPMSALQTGTNTIAVKVFQDAATGTWSVNPTFFQAVLTVPTQP